MPFITKERRQDVEDGVLSRSQYQPGDLCYVFYKEMVETWKANPRWATAHEIYKKMMEDFTTVYYCSDDEDNKAAYGLAWQIFFQLHVMPYEEKKREENGDV